MGPIGDQRYQRDVPDRDPGSSRTVTVTVTVTAAVAATVAATARREAIARATPAVIWVNVWSRGFILAEDLLLAVFGFHFLGLPPPASSITRVFANTKPHVSPRK